MSEPTIERSYFWVFDQEQLEAAITAYFQRLGRQTGQFQGRDAEQVRDFLHSNDCVGRGMRRGGED